jgi:hypothetical protein
MSLATSSFQAKARIKVIWTYPAPIFGTGLTKIYETDPNQPNGSKNIRTSFRSAGTPRAKADFTSYKMCDFSTVDQGWIYKQFWFKDEVNRFEVSS